MPKKIIRGGTIVTAVDTVVADVLIDGEKIAGVGSFEGVDAEVLDATGCFVMPGAIDNHTHLSMPFGGTWSCDDYTTGTAAAAAGGTTCIVDFCIQYVGGTLKDALAEWHGRADGAAHVDYGFHMAITDASPAVVAEMGQCVQDGVTSFKVFMAYKGALMVDDEQFLAVLEETGKTGGLVMVHCENGDAVVRYQKEAMAAGNTSHGLLPIENSVGGSIHRNYDLLLEHDLPIVAETELQVVHNLIALPGTELSQIRRVCSHPQALAQCEQFLRRLPNVEIVATYDTAGSARLIRDQKLTDTAAVASARAAEIFSLNVLQKAKRSSAWWAR